MRAASRSSSSSTPRGVAAIAATLLGLACWSGTVRAQTPAQPSLPPPAEPTHVPAARPRIDPPRGTVRPLPAASTGTASIDDAKFATAAMPVADVTHATELDLNAGGLFNAGNARSIALTAGGRLRIRREAYEFSAGLVGNYGRASTQNNPSQDTVSNIQGRLRHDLFFRARISAFTMLTARFDPFLGLQSRVRVDPGLAFYAIQGAKHRLWGEFGYDFQHDVRRVHDERQDCFVAGVLVPEGCFELRVPNVAQGMGARVIDRTLGVHSLRIFAGYVNQLSEIITLTTNLEYIQPFVPSRSGDVDPPRPGLPVVPRLRMWVNWDVAVNVQVYRALSFATTFTLRHDNAPLPGVRSLDTITALNVLYKFF